MTKRECLEVMQYQHWLVVFLILVILRMFIVLFYRQIERERIAYAQIDWHDFVVVQTVDFPINDTGDVSSEF